MCRPGKNSFVIDSKPVSTFTACKCLSHPGYTHTRTNKASHMIESGNRSDKDVMTDNWARTMVFQWLGKDDLMCCFYTYNILYRLLLYVYNIQGAGVFSWTNSWNSSFVQMRTTLIISSFHKVIAVLFWSFVCPPRDRNTSVKIDAYVHFSLKCAIKACLSKWDEYMVTT